MIDKWYFSRLPLVSTNFWLGIIDLHISLNLSKSELLPYVDINGLLQNHLEFVVTTSSMKIYFTMRNTCSSRQGPLPAYFLLLVILKKLPWPHKPDTIVFSQAAVPVEYSVPTVSVENEASDDTTGHYATFVDSPHDFYEIQEEHIPDTIVSRPVAVQVVYLYCLPSASVLKNSLHLVTKELAQTEKALSGEKERRGHVEKKFHSLQDIVSDLHRNKLLSDKGSNILQSLSSSCSALLIE